MACGYAGVRTLKVTHWSKGYQQHLSSVTLHLAKHHDRKTSSSPNRPFIAFLYNTDYDPQKYGIGNKYNETWVTDQTQTTGHSHALYEGKESYHDVVNDWKHATQVARLKVLALPKDMKSAMGASQPATGSMNDYKIIIPMGDAIYQAEKENALLWMIRSKGIDGIRKLQGKELQQLKQLLEPSSEPNGYFEITASAIKYFQFHQDKWLERPWKDSAKPIEQP